jgi:hypothetical protein
MAQGFRGARAAGAKDGPPEPVNVAHQSKNHKTQTNEKSSKISVKQQKNTKLGNAAQLGLGPSGHTCGRDAFQRARGR